VPSEREQERLLAGNRQVSSRATILPVALLAAERPTLHGEQSMLHHLMMLMLSIMLLSRSITALPEFHMYVLDSLADGSVTKRRKKTREGKKYSDSRNQRNTPKRKPSLTAQISSSLADGQTNELIEWRMHLVHCLALHVHGTDEHGKRMSANSAMDLQTNYKCSEQSKAPNQTGILNAPHELSVSKQHGGASTCWSMQTSPLQRHKAAHLGYINNTHALHSLSASQSSTTLQSKIW
jgi:hypothetical protein